jgi:hypothetical protein
MDRENSNATTGIHTLRGHLRSFYGLCCSYRRLFWKAVKRPFSKIRQTEFFKVRQTKFFKAIDSTIFEDELSAIVHSMEFLIKDISDKVLEMEEIEVTEEIINDIKTLASLLYDYDRKFSK